jgi:hypothetical protein
MTHPAALVAKVPNTITPTNGPGGLPSAAKNTAHRAGIIKISLPAGLSHLNSLTTVSNVDSRWRSDSLSISILDLIFLTLDFIKF